MKPQFDEQYHLFEKDWWWFIGRRDLISKMSRIAKSKHGKVLEIGCGSGENSNIFDDDNAGMKYYGVDISSNSIRNGDNNDKVLIMADAKNIPFRDSTFDIVLFLDVLEHLENEKFAIRDAYRVLKNDGYLFVLAPAFKFLWNNHDILNQHKRRYSKGELVTKMMCNGFNIVRISYWNFFLFVPVIFTKMIKGIISRQETADFVNMPNVLNNMMLTNILKIENYLIEKGLYLPIGVSIFCICMKNKDKKRENKK